MCLVEAECATIKAIGRRILHRVLAVGGGWQRTEDERRTEAAAQAAVADAVNRQFEVPAPDAKAVEWKRKNLAFATSTTKVALERRKWALDRDEARLGLTPTS